MPPQIPPSEHIVMPQRQKTGVGPTVGIVIIIVLMILAAIYFWGAHLNQQNQDPLPLIPGDTVSMN